MSIKKLGIALAIGVWVALYAYLQTWITGLFGIEAEIWPVLMAPAMVGLLGHGKVGIKKFYASFTMGILAACAFILLEHAIVPVMGTLGVLLPLAVLVALIVGLGFVLPQWFNGGTFIAFCASTILTSGILELTLIRIAVLLIGASIFLLVEQTIVKVLSKPARTTSQQEQDS